MKTTTRSKGRPEKYTRTAVLRFIDFMSRRNRLAVLPMVPAYNKAVGKAKQVKHIPLLVAMARHGLNMKKILTDSGKLVGSVVREIKKIKQG